MTVKNCAITGKSENKLDTIDYINIHGAKHYNQKKNIANAFCNNFSEKYEQI